VDTQVDIELHLLVDAIYLKYHYDFRRYAPASLKRRLTAALLITDELLDARAQLAELMKPVREPGAFANWIAAPKVGIDNKPGDFEYVRIAA